MTLDLMYRLTGEYLSFKGNWSWHGQKAQQPNIPVAA
jgi:hypothetical protein